MPARRLGAHKILGGNTARRADPHCPKGYSISHGAGMAHGKLEQWWMKRRALRVMVFVFQETATHDESSFPRNS